jgi:23S rRNA pseudouridine2605 synthase
MLQRVQKIIANAGLTSRRKAEELIEEGRVTMNGKLVTLGQSADPDKDKIVVDGKSIAAERKVYLLLNKPVNVVTSLDDPMGRKTVRDIIDIPERVFPVGRLDRNASGLILLTNDGEVANRMMHPRYETPKTYIATLSTPVTPSLLERLEKGVVVDERKVVVAAPEQLGTSQVKLSIHEGRKHIVKKLFVKLGTHVDALARVALGPLQIGTLKSGQSRKLTDEEVRQLRRALKLN